MSYQAEVYNVMIASPGDVAEERNIIREVINDWNSVHSKSNKVVLLPIGWDTHSTTEMGQPPQDIINRQVLFASDILVGVFWTRIGTATKEYLSGTVEEIQRHIEAQKPTMLYFSNRPVTLKAVDMEQAKLLSQFKKSCETVGLYKEFNSTQEFKMLFYHNLQLTIQDILDRKNENTTLRNSLKSTLVMKNTPKNIVNMRNTIENTSIQDSSTQNSSAHNPSLHTLHLLPKNPLGYYMAKITEVRNVPKDKYDRPYFCYRLNGLVDEAGNLEQDENHYLHYRQDQFFPLSAGDTVEFKIGSISNIKSYKGQEKVRNIYIKDLKKV